MKTAREYAEEAVGGLADDFLDNNSDENRVAIILQTIPLEALVKCVNDARRIIERVGTVGGDSVEQCEAALKWRDQFQALSSTDQPAK